MAGEAWVQAIVDSTVASLMADIRPFRGLRYNPALVDIPKVVAPPYDEISPGYQEELYHLSPYNVVRLILGKRQDQYKEAAFFLTAWQQDGILRRDSRRALYILAQSFNHVHGTTLQRYGIIAGCRLEEFSGGMIRPHEKTLAKPKEDRFHLMLATNANLSPVFGLYEDSDRAIDRMLRRAMGARPVLELMFEKVINRLWVVENPLTIDAFAGAMKPKPILIADGHHRYETALTHRDMMRLKTPGHSGEEPFNFVMMFLSSMNHEGLVILPIHRVVHGLTSFDPTDLQMRLARDFTITAVDSRDELKRTLDMHPRHTYGVVTPDSQYVISLKSEDLLASLTDPAFPPQVREPDVTLLHCHIIEGILGISQRAQELNQYLDYTHSMGDAFLAVRQRGAQVAFILNPMTLEQVRSVALAGHTMLQRSTYFHPRLLSGMVMNLLEW